jgi:hypothetical protein
MGYENMLDRIQAESDKQTYTLKFSWPVKRNPPLCTATITEVVSVNTEC